MAPRLHKRRVIVRAAHRIPLLLLVLHLIVDIGFARISISLLQQQFVLLVVVVDANTDTAQVGLDYLLGLRLHRVQSLAAAQRSLIRHGSTTEVHTLGGMSLLMDTAHNQLPINRA